MIWYDPRSWFTSTTPTSTPETVSTLPPPTSQPPLGARRRTRSTRTFTVRHGRKGSKRYHSKRHRTGKKSNRS
jgi:hypothetical protein